MFKKVNGICGWLSALRLQFTNIFVYSLCVAFFEFQRKSQLILELKEFQATGPISTLSALIVTEI